MRISGINIPDNKRIDVSLCYLYGVGASLSKKILKETAIDPSKRAKELTPDEVNKIQNLLEKKYKVEGELRQIIKHNVTMLKEMLSYRGMRHSRRLPVRGQRTKTNSRTVRGNTRKTAGSGKRKTELK